MLRADLVIDHSVQVDHFGTPLALRANAERAHARNRERYALLRWAQGAFRNLTVLPPDNGIVHQVNLEHLARVVLTDDWTAPYPLAYPDTVLGTDSHTTMINGLGVLGWGVGGIEAEAAMLGQPVSMLIPEVVGFKLHGRLPEGATATDLVLAVTEMLRKKGVVGKFVEFTGDRLAGLPLADRATIANMAPEYGATCGIFPVDAETLRYLRFTGRPEWLVELVEAYTKEQGLFHTAQTPEAVYSDTLALDLGTVEPSLAGPTRPEERVRLREAGKAFAASLPLLLGKAADSRATVPVLLGDTVHELGHGAIVIAAITSCTNTSNPSVMLAAGLLARKAVEKGLQSKPWVKTSLAPGSRVVTDYLNGAGLLPYLERLRFHLVGYGCTTCNGNSGPLLPAVSRGIEVGNLAVAAVLSGNRNFEGRVHPEVRASYLASPPLVVAYALAGRMDIDLTREPLGTDPAGGLVYLRDIWPTQREVQEAVERCLRTDLFHKAYGDASRGDAPWDALPVQGGACFAWDADSTYVRRPPYFAGLGPRPAPPQDLRGARVLAVLGDNITTDHISPAGAIAEHSSAGRYLRERGVAPADFNTYGTRRGNHEVMVRGTFANVRLRNRLAPGTEGGVTRHLPDGTLMPVFDAALRYRAEGVPLVVLAGKAYGCGSSRDWAAKGPLLLGVRAVIAESYERIHRSNLVGMGILPLEFRPGEGVAALGLTGEEIYDLEGLAGLQSASWEPGRQLTVRVRRADGSARSFRAGVRIDTPQEARYFEHGGILPYVLRQLLAGRPGAGG
jgi:aconitate hydratase